MGDQNGGDELLRHIPRFLIQNFGEGGKAAGIS